MAYKHHCCRCGFNYVSNNAARYDKCPKCGATGDRDAAIVTWVPGKHAPIGSCG